MSSKAFKDAATYFGCDSASSFKMQFGVQLETAVALWKSLELPDLKGPYDLLLALWSLAEDDHFFEKKKPVPRRAIGSSECMSLRETYDVIDEILSLFGSVVPIPLVPLRKATIAALNKTLGFQLTSDNGQSRRNGYSGCIAKILQSYQLLQELENQRYGPEASKLDHFTLRAKWGRLQFARLLKASKTEKLQKNFQRLNSRKLLPPKLGCKDKRAFEHTFGLHPQTCADIWNHDMDKLSFKAKPKHLLATLILLKSQDDSPLYFATKPSVNEEWVQRVLKQIASLSDSNMVRRSISEFKSNLESLSEEWGILKDSSVAGDPTVLESINVLSQLKYDWKLFKSGPKLERGFMAGPTPEEFEKMKQEFRNEFPEGDKEGSGWEACCEALDLWVSMAPQKKHSFKGAMYRYLSSRDMDICSYTDAIYYISKYLPNHLPLSDSEYGKLLELQSN